MAEKKTKNKFPEIDTVHCHSLDSFDPAKAAD